MRSTLGATKTLYVVSTLECGENATVETGECITVSIELEEPYAFWNSEKGRPFSAMTYGTLTGLPSGILLKPQL